MGLRKLLASVLLVSGLTLFGGAVVVAVDGFSATALDGPALGGSEVQVSTPPETANPINTNPINTGKVEAVWRAWMEQHAVTQSSLAIGRKGAILHSAAQKRRPDTAYPVASLSKAITGMCLNQLLTDGPYSWSSTLADLAPEFAKMNFTPARQMADVTLTQIATHTSGLPKTLNYGKMSTHAVNLSSQPTMARAALKEPSNFGPRGSYVYSNANYAILGFLIEAMTGEPYSEYCNDRIMAPAGAPQAVVAGRMSYTAGYGGWLVSAEDYARFAMYWFNPAQPWMQTPARFGYDKGAHYGMGTYVYPTQAGTFVSHTGRWTHKDPRKHNIGALFFVRADGLTVVVNWDGSLDWALYKQLHQDLRDAL